MGLTLDYRKHTLRFSFDAGTSRGVLREKDSWIVKVSDTRTGIIGLGECGPLKGLSIETEEEVEQELNSVQQAITSASSPKLNKALHFVSQLTSVSSVRLALETATLDLINGGKRLIFDNQFSRGESPIAINGLVWMGEKDLMKAQIDEKINAGFTCIKIKIGAIDFEEELSVLGYIRTQYASEKLTIRVDANGAFTTSEALDKLKALHQFDLHSIEQPIAPGQQEAMHELCHQTPIPIALDEELIGVNEKVNLLKNIRPQFVILKPSLIGGMVSTMDWIRIADELKVGWWITSALESNIGLNAIAQLTANYSLKIPQGLGTGKLYQNNFDSPLTISKGLLEFDKDKVWNYSELGDFVKG